MPIARFQMPDGRIGRFEVPEGTTPEQAQELISQHLNLATPQFPKAKAPEEAPDTGFTGAFKSSLQGLKGEAALLAGKTGLMDEAEAQKTYEEAKKQQGKMVWILVLVLAILCLSCWIFTTIGAVKANTFQPKILVSEKLLIVGEVSFLCCIILFLVKIFSPTTATLINQTMQYYWNLV